MLDLPIETTTWWSSRDAKESNPEHYENPKQLLDIFQKLSEQESVLIGGEGGSGKSTTLTAMVKLFEINKIPHGTLSPKSIDVKEARNLHTSVGTLLDWATQLEEYEQKDSKVKPVIVMDSADYLHVPIIILHQGKLRYFSYEDLANKDEKDLTITEIDVLENYKARIRLMRALSSGKYKVLGTFHTNWPEDNMERTLYKEFKNLFPKESVYKLEPLKSNLHPL